MVPTFVGLTGLTWFNPPTRVFHVFPNPSPVPFPKPPACTKFQEILQDSLILGLRQMLGASDLSASQPGRHEDMGKPALSCQSAAFYSTTKVCQSYGFAIIKIVHKILHSNCHHKNTHGQQVTFLLLHSLTVIKDDPP